MARTLRFRIWAWLAVVAMLFASMAPAVAHAVRASTDSAGPLAEICTAFGLKRIALGAGLGADADLGAVGLGAVDPPSSQPADQHSADCPFCQLHVAIVPSPTLHVVAGPALAHEAVPRFVDSPQSLQHRPAHRPRGPPAAS